jgi:hypothetical protein
LADPGAAQAETMTGLAASLAIVGIGLISVLLGLTHFDGGVFRG